jgi:hypothetical protein
MIVAMIYISGNIFLKTSKRFGDFGSALSLLLAINLGMNKTN